MSFSHYWYIVCISLSASSFPVFLSRCPRLSTTIYVFFSLTPHHLFVRALDTVPRAYLIRLATVFRLFHLPFGHCRADEGRQSKRCTFIPGITSDDKNIAVNIEQDENFRMTAVESWLSRPEPVFYYGRLFFTSFVMRQYEYSPAVSNPIIALKEWLRLSTNKDSIRAN